MNERIQQLAEQAGFKYIKDEGIGWAGNYNASLPKFAELIVRQCIDIAQDRANFPGFPPNDVNNIIDEIREHFGVEE